MARFRPNIEIISHFDELINRLDSEIKKSLEIYCEDEVLGKQQYFELKNRRVGNESKFKLDFFDLYESSLQQNTQQCEDFWAKWTRVGDYLNEVRKSTIEELKTELEDSLEKSSEFSHLRVEITDEKNKEELKSQLFAHKFYFQINLTSLKNKSWIFNLYTFVTDFYMSPSDINLLE